MAKIIKHSKKYKHTCDYCGCIFSYRESEVDWGDYQGHEPNTHIRKYRITCPECGHRLLVKAEQVSAPSADSDYI